MLALGRSGGPTLVGVLREKSCHHLRVFSAGSTRSFVEFTAAHRPALRTMSPQCVAGFFKWTRLLHTNNKVWIFIKLHKDVSLLIWSAAM